MKFPLEQDIDIDKTPELNAIGASIYYMNRYNSIDVRSLQISTSQTYFIAISFRIDFPYEELDYELTEYLTLETNLFFDKIIENHSR